jgi:hypothetical protein
MNIKKSVPFIWRMVILCFILSCQQNETSSDFKNNTQHSIPDSLSSQVKAVDWSAFYSYRIERRGITNVFSFEKYYLQDSTKKVITFSYKIDGDSVKLLSLNDNGTIIIGLNSRQIQDRLNCPDCLRSIRVLSNLKPSRVLCYPSIGEIMVIEFPLRRFIFCPDTSKIKSENWRSTLRTGKRIEKNIYEVDF